MNYLPFIRNNFRFLSFGFVLAWFSSFGQTFLISLFNHHFQTTFNLTHAELGGIYSLATLASGFILIWAGKKIDDMPLRKFSLLVSIGLIVACLLMSWSPTVLFLGVAFFALRLFGQGLMSHISVVSMARYFPKHRGKALSIAGLGHPVGEAVFPLIIVLLLGMLNWRWLWIIFAIFIAILLLPKIILLLKDHEIHFKKLIAEEHAGDDLDADKTLKQVLADLRFYVILFYVLATPCLVTGFFFHQVHLAEVKGWNLEWLAGSIIAYAVATVVTSVAAGRWVDQFSAKILMPYYLLPMALGLFVLSVSNHVIIPPIYLFLLGVSAGGGFSIGSAFWAEFYGVKHLGAIRSAASAMMVFSTAVSPVLIGWLIDQGISIEIIAFCSVIYILLATISLWLMLKFFHD